MILILITVVLFCVSVVCAWRKRWKNSLLYLLGAVISLLLYSLWAQANISDYQKTKIEQLNTKINELQKQIIEVKK